MVSLEFSEGVGSEHRDYLARHVCESAEQAAAVYERHGLLVPSSRIIIDITDSVEDTITAGAVNTELSTDIFVWFEADEVNMRDVSRADTVDTIAHERAHVLRASVFEVSGHLIDLVADEGVAYHIGTSARYSVTGRHGDDVTRRFNRARHTGTASAEIEEFLRRAAENELTVEEIVHDLLEPTTVDDAELYYPLALQMGIYEVEQHRLRGSSFLTLLGMGSRRIVDTWLF